MGLFPFRKPVLQPGPIMSLMLIGILLLSAVIYYRAINVQRFLEPALALSEPRLKFSQNIRDILSKEFDTQQLKGVRFKSGSIFVEQSMLIDPSQPMKEVNPEVMKKLSRVFTSVLNTPEIRSNISLILVCMSYPSGPNTLLNKEFRFYTQERAVLLLNSLFFMEPELEKNYGRYFAAAALPASARLKEPPPLEFRLIPTEQLHIEVLQRLEKYSY
ncbi:MAG: hypothetical protein OEW04_07405 [Nitrospirota bacterium]|nr:hypothetical protein [Nitrospirota bacterium]